VEDEDKNVDAGKDSPQMIEVQAQLTELKNQLTQATGVIESQTTEIDKFRTSADQVAAAKLATERDLKSALAVETTPKKRTAEDVNSLNNVEMLNIIAETVDSAISAERTDASNQMDKNYQGLDNKFDQVVKYLQNQSVSNERRTMQETHKDFDKLTPQISLVLEKYPGMNYQDAYSLAKASELDTQMSNKHIETEKGDAPSAAQDDVNRVAKKKPATTKGGRRSSFRTRLEEAVGRTIDARNA
jgi:hypothetical protein